MTELPLAPVRRGYVDTSCGQMHYREAGAGCDGTAILCLHMSPYSGAMYERFLGVLGCERHVFALDTPGYGLSDPPQEQPEYEVYAGAVADFVKGIGLHQVDLIGYHTGSFIATELANAQPDLVRRLVLVSAPIFYADDRHEIRDTNGPIVLTEDGSHLSSIWQRAIHWSMEGRTLEQVARVFPDRIRSPERMQRRYYEASEFDMEGGLKALTQAVLILNPEDDVVKETARAKGMATHAQSQFLDLPGWSHGFLDLHTEEFAEITRAFLQ
jgi:pimeloyl-ACP methyl ester carboxylesterase